MGETVAQLSTEMGETVAQGMGETVAGVWVKRWRTLITCIGLPIKFITSLVFAHEGRWKTRSAADRKAIRN